jgi:hypothetical protein
MDELSSEELADRTPQGRFRPSDIQRIRVVDTLAEAGFAPEQLSQLLATGAYDLHWASVVFPEPTAQLTTTLEETAAATGLPEDLAARLFDAWELPRPQTGQALRADDEELLHLDRRPQPRRRVHDGQPRAHAGPAVPPPFRALRAGRDRAPGRGGPGAGRTGSPPPGPPPGHRLSRPHRLHQAHRGARRPGRGRADRPAGRDRP